MCGTRNPQLYREGHDENVPPKCVFARGRTQKYGLGHFVFHFHSYLTRPSFSYELKHIAKKFKREEIATVDYFSSLNKIYGFGRAAKLVKQNVRG